MRVIDIHSRSADPVAARLSNFELRPFVLDDVRCASVEGWIQSLKFPDLLVQAVVAGLHGYTAFKKGQEGNRWKLCQVLWWRGKDYGRDDPSYQALLTRAYDAQFDQNPGVAEDLLKTVGRQLRHTMGKHNSHDTTLTESEYIRQLERLRWRALLAVSKE